MEANKFDIVIIANGAGELSALVRPTVYKIAEKLPQARVILILPPCQYATGREYEIARQIKGVHRIVRPWEYFKWLIFRVPIKDLKFDKKGIVIFMGGDLLHGKIISGRLKFPAIAYTEHHTSYKGSYKKFLVPDKLIFEKFRKRGLETEKMEIIGNLMVDGVMLNLKGSSKEEVAKRWDLDPHKKIISFLPGSRNFQIGGTLPYYLSIAEIISKKLSDIQMAIILSPYMTMDKLNRTLKKYFKNTSLITKDDGLKHITKNDTSFIVVDSNQHDFIKHSTLAVTIPGTNTAEIGTLQTPMLVFFPFDRLDLVPFEGVFGWICSLPIVGFYLKALYGKILDCRTRFFAIPNKKIGREIVPELRGWFTPKEIAERVVSLLKDQEKLNRMKDELKVAMGPTGASNKIVEEILKQVTRD